jgi:hypothetical protein
MTPGNCRTCRYWFQPDEEVDEGICKKNPPQVFAFPVQERNLTLMPGAINHVNLRLQSFFPPVSGGASCWKWSVDEKGQKN